MDHTPIPLTAPADGVPAVTDTDAALTNSTEAIERGSGPIAVDAERASGYRYGQRAYLIQLRREGSGTHLVDPTAEVSLEGLARVLSEPEWILHAASQDLPCLHEVGLYPSRIFDTELAGRLLGFERVGLGYLVADVLGLQLAKEHSAVDWSTRPLPVDWLNYAALDVEVLIELRAALRERLESEQKLEWALQEFEHERTAPPPSPKVDPWRRVAGRARVSQPSILAVIREMWLARDELARSLDTAPGRVLPDAAIAAAATSRLPGDRIGELREFRSRSARRHLEIWKAAATRGQELNRDHWPPRRGPATEKPPQARQWREKAPEAFERLTEVKATLTEIAQAHALPVENLLSPVLARQLAWKPPESVTTSSVDSALEIGGARPWQRTLVAEPLASTLGSPS